MQLIHNIALTMLCLIWYLQVPSVKASDAASDGEGNATVNVEGQQYTDCGSYVMIEITLQRPLVAKRQPEELAKR